MAAVLLLGLDDHSADTIANFSLQAGHTPKREAMRITWETRPEADVVFVSGDRSGYQAVLDGIRQFRPALPVVVISRLGETAAWIEALEAGASDFLSAPYTLGQISAVLTAATTRPIAAAA